MAGLTEPPADSNLGRAARAVAEVFGCPVEEAAEVLRLGIDARMAEQAGRQAAINEHSEQPIRGKDGKTQERNTYKPDPLSPPG